MDQQTKNNIKLDYISLKRETINSFLLRKGYSSNNIYELIKNQNVFIDNKPVKDKNIYLKFKPEIVSVTLNNEFSGLPFCFKAINIVYEDEYLLIVNKDYNYDIEPTKANYEDNLACAINYYYSQKGIKSKIHLVNRLDKLTRGLVIVAKNQYIHNLFSKVKITKKYEALASGITKKSGVIKIKIDKEEGQIKRVISDNGKLSITKYKRKSVIDNNSLLDIKLVTGRTHQIRLSLQSIGHPLVNDPIYAIESNGEMYLKAYYLRFRHPITKKQIKVKI